MKSEIDLKIAKLQKELDGMSKGSIHYAPQIQKINLLLAEKNSNSKKWYESLFGILFLGVVASIIAWAILHYLGYA